MESCAKELHGNGGHACRAGCGGRLHGICGEVEDPEGNEKIGKVYDVSTSHQAPQRHKKNDADVKLGCCTICATATYSNWKKSEPLR